MIDPSDPWHSFGETVHHTWRDCSAAKMWATPWTSRSGTGWLPLCIECARMTKAAIEGAKPPENPRSN
jgi:hypothetical protein